MNLTISKKLALGFASVLTLTAFSGAIIFEFTRLMMAEQEKAFGTEVPASKLTLSLEAEINRALAMHRGYMLLADEEMVEERHEAWRKIELYTPKLGEKISEWNEGEVTQKYEQLSTILTSFQHAQDHLEEISHTPADYPATTLFYESARPHAEVMDEELRKIIHLEETQETNSDRLVMINRISEIRGHLLKMNYAIAGFLERGNEENRQMILAEIEACGNAALFLQENRSWMTDEQSEAFDIYVAEREDFLVDVHAVLDRRSSEDWCISEHHCQTVATPLATEALELLGTIRERAIQRLDNTQSIVSTKANIMQIATVAGTGLAIVFGGIIAFLIARSIIVPLRGVINRLREIAEGDGDLTQRVPDDRKDELGELGEGFNLFVSKVYQLVVSVNGAAEEVAGASGDLSVLSREMAQELDQQQSQVQQISAASEEMSASVMEVTDGTREASERAADAGREAGEGGQIVEGAIEDIRSIASFVEESASEITNLSTRSKQIGEVIQVINEIADQTNLLALNAAIEAARAGEHGRGFAVVADEVRKLADRTTKATDEIANEIQAIQEETGSASKRMDAGLSRVRQGVERAGQAACSLNSIVNGSQDVATLISSIATSSEQQAQATEQVNESIVSITHAITRASESSSNTATAITAVSKKADQLKTLISKFKLHAPDRRIGETNVPKDIQEKRHDPRKVTQKMLSDYGLQEKEQEGGED
ncbi:MAG: methyl-accepting chemotaxis protein [Planctomycetota bacterium]